MSGLQWLFIIGAGVAGYFAVSYLIDRSRRSTAAPPASNGPEPQAPQQDVFQRETSSESGQSAWDEFQRKDAERR